jgi:hypothetical protein
LEELIDIAARKRARPRLAERKILVTGRRMERFVPPVWKPRRRVPICSVSKQDSTVEIGAEVPICSIGKKVSEVEVGVAVPGKGEEKKATGWNVDTRSDRGSLRKHLRAEASAVENSGADEEFYNQLWDCSPADKGRAKISSRTLVWVRKDLLESQSFTEQECFPFPDGDTPSMVKECCLAEWKGRRKSSLLRIRRKCVMAEWNRSGGGGRGGRGGRWRHPGFFHEQNYPPPFNPFFFPCFGFDPCQPGGNFRPPPRGPAPREPPPNQ